MRRTVIKIVALAAWASLAAAWPSAITLAQSAPDLAGTWTLVSSVTEKNGTTTEQFGHGAKGMLSLDGGGHFMLTIIGPNLPRFASNNRAGGTPEETKAVVGNSIAMIGTYSVNPGDNTLVFRVESSTFPNWNGTEQRRTLVTADRDQLKYITATASSGGIGTVIWKRAQ
jgi:hypothetical protein